MSEAENLNGIKKGGVYELPEFTISQAKNLRVAEDMESDNSAHFEDNYIIGALLDGIVREYLLQFVKRQLLDTHIIKRTFVLGAPVEYIKACKAPASFVPIATVVEWNIVEGKKGRMSMKFSVELMQKDNLIAKYVIRGFAFLKEVNVSDG